MSSRGKLCTLKGCKLQVSYDPEEKMFSDFCSPEHASLYQTQYSKCNLEGCENKKLEGFDFCCEEHLKQFQANSLPIPIQACLPKDILIFQTSSAASDWASTIRRRLGFVCFFQKNSVAEIVELLQSKEVEKRCLAIFLRNQVELEHLKRTLLAASFLPWNLPLMLPNFELKSEKALHFFSTSSSSSSSAESSPTSPNLQFIPSTTAFVSDTKLPESIQDANFYAVLQYLFKKKVKHCRFFSNKNEPYFELSNFYEAAFTDVMGRTWPTSEHYFQALKFVENPELLESVKNLKTARDVFQYVRGFPSAVRKDWNDVKEDVMREALQYKFTQNPALAELLRNTGEATLSEYNPKDTYWAEGMNRFGYLLMELRWKLNHELK